MSDRRHRDSDDEGLLLAKTGPTPHVASAIAVLHDVKGPVTELGYDIRKPGVTTDARGWHCGAGAPRFNVPPSSSTRGRTRVRTISASPCSTQSPLPAALLLPR